MRMKLEAAEVRHPRQRRRIARYQLFGAAAGRKLELHDLEPVRATRRCTLLEEELAIDAVRIAHQHVRATARTAQRAFCHSDVIAGDVELGDPCRWKKYLRRVGDGHLAARDR